jgi:hypothetical protein
MVPYNFSNQAGSISIFVPTSSSRFNKMKSLQTFLVLLTTASFALAASPTPKPASKPAKSSKSKTAYKPQPSMKDLAIAEARKFDTDYNGQINGTEVIQLQAEFRNNPNSRLYMFDDNSNHVLDSDEIAKIKFTPAKKPSDKKP